MILIKKALSLLMIIGLLALTVGCNKNPMEPHDNNIDSVNPNTNSSQEYQQKKDVYKETLRSYLTMPEDYDIPIYNGKLVAGIVPDGSNEIVRMSTGESSFPDTEVIYRLTKPSYALENKMKEYEGKDVWFRVLVDIRSSYGLMGEYSEDKATEYFSFTKSETLRFLEEIGAHNIKTEFNFTVATNSHSFEASMTAEMIKLFLGKCFFLTLGQYPRNPIYPVTISDTVSAKLDIMSENDTAEIIAVCVIDKNSSYARQQNIIMNYEYNSDRFKPFTEFLGITRAQYNKKIEQYLSGIFLRNNITEKIVNSKDLPKVKLDCKEWELDKNFSFDSEEDIPLGFNAVLTKAEILKLAEDPEIKVIYLAPQK